jgi:alpha/beta superfamily hydrolase
MALFELERLESAPEVSRQPLTVAVICHPHPQHGGTMRNKIVTTLYRAFDELGCHTVRFNFRGVGKSEGEYGNKVGELEDLISILDGVAIEYPNADIWLAGFSFGAYIAIRAVMDWRLKNSIKQLVSIAPPVSYFKNETLPDIRCPWLVVQGLEDEVVSASDVFDWLKTLSTQPEVIRMPGVTHFFHGHLIALRELLVAYLRG